MSIFSTLFDAKRGLYRAEAYLKVLNDSNTSLYDKHLNLFALFNSKDGATLQGDVAMAMFGCRNLSEARKTVRNFLAISHGLPEHPEKLPAEIHREVAHIIRTANNAGAGCTITRLQPK
ncbi:MAG: hypothetical protein WC785_04880 [Tatlockia sp.]